MSLKLVVKVYLFCFLGEKVSKNKTTQTKPSEMMGKYTDNNIKQLHLQQLIMIIEGVVRVQVMRMSWLCWVCLDICKEKEEKRL